MAEAEIKYRKKIVIEDKEFARYRDLLTVILDDSKKYSKADVRKALSTELKRRVK